jgi:hypothetical protein
VRCDSCDRHYLGLDEGEYTFAPRTLVGRRTCVSCYIATIGDISEQQRRLTTRYQHHGYRFCGGFAPRRSPHLLQGAHHARHALRLLQDGRAKSVETSQEFNTEGARNDK